MAFWQRIRSLFRSSRPAQEDFRSIQLQAEKLLNHRFHNILFLEKALTHASFAAQQELPYSYERLEFLGDAVLQLAVTEYLFKAHPHLNEGTLTKYRTILVNGSYLAECANAMKLQDLIRMTGPTRNSRGRETDSILADVVESLIAALYLDGGMTVAQSWVEKEIISRKPNYIDDLKSFNFKGQLAERCQRLHLGTPDYEVTSTEGPDHDRWYTVQVVIRDRVAGFGEGHTKKEASQRASEDTINNWDVIFPDKN